MDIQPIWTPGAFVLGAQIAFVSWRIQRELKLEGEEVNWLPLSDWLNFASMICTVAFVFCIPIIGRPLLGLAPDVLAARAFGASAILLVGYLASLAGHYRLFFGGRGPRPWLTGQEAICVLLTCGALAGYLVALQSAR